MEPIYLELFNEPSWRDTPAGKYRVFEEFEVPHTEVEGVNILLAYYSYEDYSGLAFVLFEKNGKLYEVNGSHCSCDGLGRQWDPEETNIEALRYRTEEGGLGRDYFSKGNLFADELSKVLDELSKTSN
jgi:hypothetical protein